MSVRDQQSKTGWQPVSSKSLEVVEHPDKDVERLIASWGSMETDKRMLYVNIQLHFNSNVFLHGRCHSWKEIFIHRVI